MWIFLLIETWAVVIKYALARLPQLILDRFSRHLMVQAVFWLRNSITNFDFNLCEITPHLTRLFEVTKLQPLLE